jgi:hypothetical protein
MFTAGSNTRRSWGWKCRVESVCHGAVQRRVEAQPACSKWLPPWNEISGAPLPAALASILAVGEINAHRASEKEAALCCTPQRREFFHISD